jgi:serine/threonine protein kinase
MVLRRKVYRARDTRLMRDVAVTVLPDLVAKDEVRLGRFAQEARAISALNHPNILSIHDVGATAGTYYIVTELLEGSTPRERLASGGLSPHRATEYATQIAKGLAAAHEKGVIHPDLKPENLFITREGPVKTLVGFDFVKLSSDARAEEVRSRSKAEILDLLRNEGEKFAGWLDTQTPEFLAEMVTVADNTGTKSRFEQPLGAKEHEMHHRGQLMLIERQLGIVPHLTRQAEERLAQTATGCSGS